MLSAEKELKREKKELKSPLILVSNKSRLASHEMVLPVFESKLSPIRFIQYLLPGVKFKSNLTESTFFH